MVLQNKIQVFFILFFVLVFQSIPLKILEGADFLFLTLLILVYFENFFWSFVYTLSCVIFVFLIKGESIEMILFNYMAIPLTFVKIRDLFTVSFNKWSLCLVLFLPLYISINLLKVNRLTFTNWGIHLMHNLFIFLGLFIILKLKSDKIKQNYQNR
jgi:hypothetical protein